MPSERPSGAFRFKVEIDGVVVAHFQGVAGMSSEHEVITHIEGGRNDRGIKLPGQGQFGTITLKRGYASERTLRDWISDVSSAGRALRRSLSVIVLGDDADDEVGRYDVLEAWPRKWEIQELQGESLEVVETLELAHNGLSWKVGTGRSAGAAGVAARAAAAARAARAARRARDVVRAAADAADGARRAGQGAAASAAAGVGAAAAGAGAARSSAGAGAAAAAAASAAAGVGPGDLEAGWQAGGGFEPEPAAAVSAALAEGPAAAVGPAAPPDAANAATDAARSFGRGAPPAGGPAAVAGGPAGVWSDGVDRNQSVQGFGEAGLPAGFGGPTGR